MPPPPPPPRPVLFIRLTHSGQYADGRPNHSPVLIPDLDVGYENQDRKVPVYVPPGGYIDINASSRSMLSFEQGGILKFTQAGIIGSKMFYVPEAVTTGTLPDASDYPAGVFVWNTTEDQAYWSDGTNWMAGNAPMGTAGGDLSGTYPNPTVVSIQGRAIQDGAEPTNGDVLVYNTATHQWEHTTLTFGGGPPVGPAGGSLAGLYPNPTLTSVGTAGTYGNAANVPILTTTLDGRVSGVTPTPIQIAETQVTNLTSDLSGKALKTTSVLAGTGLTGGGTLSSNVTLSMPSVGTAGTYGNAATLPLITTDTQGRVSGVVPTAIQITEAQVTGLAGDLAAKVPNTLQVLAGTGLTGGGTLSSNVTLSMPTVVAAGTYGAATQVPVVTLDAQGRVTNVTPTTISGTLPGGTAGGDLAGTYPNPTVDGLQGNPVAALSPNAGDALIWTGLAWTPTSPTSMAFAAKLGNVLVVDQVNGNDLIGTVSGPPFRTIEAAIQYINVHALTGVTIWVMPGTYTMASATVGLIVPDTCAIRGLNTQTVRVGMNASNPGGTVTLLTMGENTRVEDLTLTLNSTNATTNLVGIRLPGTTSVTSKLRTTVVTVDNSGVPVGSSTNVYGVLSDGTGALNAGTFSFNTLKGSTLNVYSNGSGNKFGIYQPSSNANQISTRDMNIYVRPPLDETSIGFYVGIYTDNAGSQIQTRATTIGGSPYPAVQLKLPVSVAATTNIALTGTYTLQGVVLAVGDRVLAAGQTTGTNNGVYVVQSGAWTRAIDMAAGSAALGAYIFCLSGTYRHTGWECTTNINVGAGALTFLQRYAGSDILQNAPLASNGPNGIQLGPGTDIVTKTACAHPFTLLVTPTSLQFCLRGNIDAGTHWLWPGTLVNTMDNTEVFYRTQQKVILQGMCINLRTAPGVGESLTVTVSKSFNPVGPGAPTLINATISGTATSATCYTASLDLRQFEYLSVQVVCSNGADAADLSVELDIF